MGRGRCHGAVAPVEPGVSARRLDAGHRARRAPAPDSQRRIYSKPVEGVPAVYNGRLAGLLAVALHPRLRENQLVYLSYTKVRADKRQTTVHSRAPGLAWHSPISAKSSPPTPGASRKLTSAAIIFGREGFLFLAVGERQDQKRAQDHADHRGKMLRLRRRRKCRWTIRSSAERATCRRSTHSATATRRASRFIPTTGVPWETENGPLGGDEINISEPGRNYGWPLVIFGTGVQRHGDQRSSSRPDLELPFIYFVPSLATSGITFYTGDRFPQWKGNAFIGAMVEDGQWHRPRPTHHVQR